MGSRTRWVTVVLALAVAAGCGEDTGAPDYDAAAVTDLRVVFTSAVGATLNWTAPEVGGRWAQAYEVRALAGETGDFDWDGAVAVAGEPAPSVPGLTETCRATGLASGTTYRVTMRFGADGWWSPLSNVVTFTTIAAPPIPDGFVYLPAGTFTCGSPADEKGRDDDEISHAVTLTRGFFLAEVEVTQALWAEVMGVNPSDTTCASCPVTQVSFEDALAFCNLLSLRDGWQPCYDQTTWDHDANGYRLPTEAEWEYACRAGATTAFSSGDIDSLDCTGALYLDLVGHYCYNSRDITEVGGKPANAWGLYDMHGNVWELCWDWYHAYVDGAVTDPVGPASGYLRVMRGGGWNSTSQQCRAASRSAVSPTWRTDSIGLRLARDAD